jgi:hypothetical protein
MREHQNPVVDLASFNVMIGKDRMLSQALANALALCLMTYTSIDDYHAPDDWSVDSPWTSTVGTGGSGMVFRVATQGYQRSMLAAHFASYGSCQYDSCYLGLPEYQCLKELYRYLTEDFSPSGHYGENEMYDYHLDILKDTLNEFKVRYAKVDEHFLFELLKT